MKKVKEAIPDIAAVSAIVLVIGALMLAPVLMAVLARLIN